MKVEHYHLTIGARPLCEAGLRYHAMRCQYDSKEEARAVVALHRMKYGIRLGIVPGRCPTTLKDHKRP